MASIIEKALEESKAKTDELFKPSLFKEILDVTVPGVTRLKELRLKKKFGDVFALQKLEEEKKKLKLDQVETKESKPLNSSNETNIVKSSFQEKVEIPEKKKTLAMIYRESAQTGRTKPENIPNHTNWKLFRVLTGHNGWVQSLAVDPTNQFFASGSFDRTIKIWDLASGKRKLTFTGHVNSVRAIGLSKRHPYMFTAGEDKSVKCWDLEVNRVIRNYHGHLSGVYSLAVHPILDVVITGGRDSSARVWDIRTSKEVRILGGHTNTVSSLIAQEANPMVITGSMDSTIKLWDLAEDSCITTLTHHTKGIRGLARHPREFSFVSASADYLKKFHCEKGRFMHNVFKPRNVSDLEVCDTLSSNEQGVLFAGFNSGKMRFFDYGSGSLFQEEDNVLQPGTMESESAVLSSTFDVTGTRLIVGCADKTIKMYKEEA
eukprot:maker-scaffold_3-snap-gene-5.4-mRNA-1 protein AED:0.00 eAED:0.00 QI:0/1/0.75/1/1/1/4/756/431